MIKFSYRIKPNLGVTGHIKAGNVKIAMRIIAVVGKRPNLLGSELLPKNINYSDIEVWPTETWL